MRPNRTTQLPCDSVPLFHRRQPLQSGAHLPSAGSPGRRRLPTISGGKGPAFSLRLSPNELGDILISGADRIFFDLESRCASSRSDERRLTRRRVQAARARYPEFPRSRSTAILLAARTHSRVRQAQRVFQRSESLSLRAAVSRDPRKSRVTAWVRPVVRPAAP
jgi:hypothetical protein